MTEPQIAAMRAYLRQWIMVTVGDHNPHAGAEELTWLGEMRARVDGLTSRGAIERWLDGALEHNIDPL
jgi:hypothetical protein